VEGSVKVELVLENGTDDPKLSASMMRRLLSVLDKMGYKVTVIDRSSSLSELAKATDRLRELSAEVHKLNLSYESRKTYE
jgi:hypothetical protein